MIGINLISTWILQPNFLFENKYGNASNSQLSSATKEFSPSPGAMHISSLVGVLEMSRISCELH